MPSLKKPNENIDYGLDPKILNNTQYILKDLIQGDNSALKGIEGLDMETIRKALNFLTNNDALDEKQKLGLLQDSWKVNYRAKPPTPEEFLTPQYLGPTSDNVHPWVRAERHVSAPARKDFFHAEGDQSLHRKAEPYDGPARRDFFRG